MSRDKTNAGQGGPRRRAAKRDAVKAVRRSTPAGPPVERGFPVGTLTELPNLMREFGHDPWELLESFGVTPELMAKPMTPLPVSVHGRILKAAADMTGRENLGLLLGQRATLQNV